MDSGNADAAGQLGCNGGYLGLECAEIAVDRIG
jgi:hypothetical protein